MTFNYTKANGDFSKRVFYPFITPNKMYEGIDISVLEVVDQVQFVEDMNMAKDIYNSAIVNIQNKYDLNQDYRRFDPKRMSDVVEETL